MEMGKTAGAQNGQRTTALLDTILNTETATESWGDSSQIRRLLAARRCGLGLHYASAVAMVNYQDDLLVAAVGWSAASAFDAAVQLVVVEETRMVLRTKEGATRPLDKAADLVGAHLETATPARPTFRPTVRFTGSL